MLAVALPRLVIFPVNENVYGDAISRTEMAERWMASPHLITAFGDGAGQYGPLHIYLIGLATGLADREVAGRLVSLLCSVLTVVPLYRLGRRLAGRQAGVVACLALAAWGLHIQLSTTAASEALAILLMVSAFDALSSALDAGSRGGLVWAAIWINLATAVRYDAWLYPPLIVLAVILVYRDRSLPVRDIVAFGAACLLFPALWMLGNYQMHGDPAFPLTYINHYHRLWVAHDYAGFWREVWLRAQGVGFWPVMAAVSLTPGVAALGAVGMIDAWRIRPASRWIIIVASAPLLYYTARVAVFLDFAPLTRFMAVFLAVMLLFVSDGYRAAVRRWGNEAARLLARLTIGLAIAMPVAMGVFTFRQDGAVRNAVRSLSPTTTNPRSVMAAAAFVRSTIAPAREGLVVDIDATYFDLALVFYGGLRQEQVIRVRSEADLPRIEAERPAVLVRFDKGSLARLEGVRVAGRALTVGNVAYDELDGFEAPVHVYRLRQ